MMSEKGFVIEKLLKEEKTVSSAESCTGVRTDKKPVGLVYVRINTPEKTKTYALRIAGERETVRQKTVKAVFRFLKTELEEKEHGKN